MLASLGLVFLTPAAGGETEGSSSDYSLAAMLAWESALVGAGTLLIVMHRQDRHESRQGVLLGGRRAALHRQPRGGQGRDGGRVPDVAPFVLIAVVAGVSAFASARSLQVGEGVAVIAVTSIASSASIPAGIVVFGDPLARALGHDRAAPPRVRARRGRRRTSGPQLRGGDSPRLRDPPGSGVDQPVLAASTRPRRRSSASQTSAKPV